MRYILLGVAAYLAYQYYKKKKGSNESANADNSNDDNTTIITTKGPDGKDIKIEKDKDGNIVLKSGLLEGKKEEVDKFMNDLKDKLKNFGFTNGTGIKFGLDATPQEGGKLFRHNFNHKRAYSNPMKNESGAYFPNFGK